MKIEFNIKNYETEDESYREFMKCLNCLVDNKISYAINENAKEFYVTTEYTGKMVFGINRVVTLKSYDDYLTYCLVKD